MVTEYTIVKTWQEATHGRHKGTGQLIAIKQCAKKESTFQFGAGYLGDGRNHPVVVMTTHSWYPCTIKELDTSDPTVADIKKQLTSLI